MYIKVYQLFMGYNAILFPYQFLNHPTASPILAERE